MLTKKKRTKKPKPIKPRNYLVPIMRKLKPGPHENKIDRDRWKRWEEEY